MRLGGDRKFWVVLLYIGSSAACFEPKERADSGGDSSVPAIDIDSPGPLHIEVGAVDTLRTAVTGARADVVYTSSHPSIATVDRATGVVQGVSPGNASITVAVGGGPNLQRNVQVIVVPRGTAPPAMTRAQLVAHTMNEVCKNEGSTLREMSTGVDDIHEYHDCQRLIRNDQYESLVGIFAHDNVGKYLNWEYANGKVVAVIVNYKTKGTTMAYEPLGLHVGTSCLVLKWNNNPYDRWSAAIVPIPAPSPENAYGECPDDMKWSDVPDEQKDLLQVRLQKNAADHDDQELAPPVARWDWDPEAGVNYMGVRCGRKRWCEVGRKGFTSLPPLKTPSGNKNLFKGYYDQQFLADENGVKSDVWATVTPGLDAVRGRIKRNRVWYETARLELEAPENSRVFEMYRTRLHLTTTTTGGRIRGEGSMRIYSEGNNAPDIGKNWHLQVNNNSVGDGIMYHRGHATQGTRRAKSVRWRWHEEDETVWSFCPEDGCCEMKRLL